MQPCPEQCTPRELRQWCMEHAEPLILDVREVWEVERCAIPGSRHIPLGELPVRLAELPAGRWIVTCCHHGRRSQTAQAILRQHGWPVTNLVGGIDAWADQVDPAMERY